MRNFLKVNLNSILKKSMLVVSALAMGLMLSLLLTSCTQAADPQAAYIDENGNLVIVLSNGSEQDMGKVADLENKQEDPHLNKPVVEVDEELHVILTYPDGTTEDLGYVGVEVEPPMFTVTFVDSDGNVLKSETLYRGKDATPPEAPEVEDKIFDKWSPDFTNVQSDLTVAANYRDKASFMVTFLDANGKEIKSEKVVEGKSATAPEAPEVAGKVFDHWDKDFSNVRSELTITAIYRDKGNYTVTFKDYSGRLLGTADVAEGGNATATVTPSREGYSFRGWSPSINGVNSDRTVVAQYQFNGGSNVIDISYELTSANTVRVTYTIRGSVKFAGCDIEIGIPGNLTYQSMDAGSGVVANKSGNSILINIAGSTNVTSETRLATVNYAFSGGDATFAVNVSEMFDQDMNGVSYAVIGRKIDLK